MCGLAGFEGVSFLFNIMIPRPIGHENENMFSIRRASQVVIKYVLSCLASSVLIVVAVQHSEFADLYAPIRLNENIGTTKALFVGCAECKNAESESIK